MKRKAKLKKSTFEILLEDPSGFKFYAQINHGFWYKVFAVSPKGCVRFDSSWTAEHEAHAPLKASHARFIIKQEALAEVSLQAVLNNWMLRRMFDTRTRERELIHKNNHLVLRYKQLDQMEASQLI